MQNLINFIVTIFAFYLIILVIFARAYIVVGTISKETEDYKKRLKSRGYKIIHADDYRSQFKNPGILAIKAFLKNFFLLKRVALFTSNSKFLKWKFVILITSGACLFVKDKRVIRSKNIQWVLNLEPKQAVEIIPDYFVSKEEVGYGDVKIEKMVEELNRYPNERFLPEKVWEGDMGGMLKHN